MTTPEEALTALQFLAAMYPLEGELELPSSTADALSSFDSGCPTSPTSLDAVVHISLDTPEPTSIPLSLSFLPTLKLIPRQPPFLTRSAYDLLSTGVSSLPQSNDLSETIMSAIEYVRVTAPTLIIEEEEVQEEVEDDGPLERVWFWFPSLSTREKRKDMVTYAPRYRLAGFVLAGKPALLCLEGGGRAVDRYMAAIKSESWGDIPSFQKKVTERLRLPLSPAERKFTTMTDVTAQISHHGTYNHRVDMGDVKRLAEEFGVGEDFNAAVMNSRDA